MNEDVAAVLIVVGLIQVVFTGLLVHAFRTLHGEWRACLAAARKNEAYAVGNCEVARELLETVALLKNVTANPN